MTEIENAERGYTITRVFDAPRELVWQCWTDPAHFAVWFGGHNGRMEDMVVEPRAGGRWSGTMVLPDGHTIPWIGEFLEVEEPSRLALAFSDQAILGTEYDTFTVTLTELAGKTELVLRQSGGHLTDEQYGEAEHGTGTFLDVLAEHLTTLVAEDLGEVTISRIYDAPREVVFAAFMDPAQLSQFWGPIGVHTPVEGIVIEPRAGGRFETTMVADDGSGEFIMKAVFTEVVPPERYGWTELDGTMTTTSTLHDLGDGRTEVVIHQTNVPAIYRTPEAQAGFKTSLDKFADYLSRR
ncbi:MAG: hypothetical protein JWM02_2567 [Frankiales bacterium]|nr:hypothetical protein [Frankiales bacterium]